MPARSNRACSTAEAIERELAAAALEKRARGQKPTQQELGALRRVERKHEEERRWEIYESIPKKHWREMSGRQAKVLLEQATRHGIPMGGRTVSLPDVVKWLHDFLAAKKLLLQSEVNETDEALRVAIQRKKLAEAEAAEMRARLALGTAIAIDKHERDMDQVSGTFTRDLEEMVMRMKPYLSAAVLPKVEAIRNEIRDRRFGAPEGAEKKTKGGYGDER